MYIIKTELQNLKREVKSRETTAKCRTNGGGTIDTFDKNDEIPVVCRSDPEFLTIFPLETSFLPLAKDRKNQPSM